MTDFNEHYFQKRTKKGQETNFLALSQSHLLRFLILFRCQSFHRIQFRSLTGRRKGRQEANYHADNHSKSNVSRSNSDDRKVNVFLWQLVGTPLS